MTIGPNEDKPRVLLVDDERFARQLYSDYLAAEGCDVETAESVQSAIGLLEPGRYHAVICDLLLPDGDGLAVLERVKRVDPECDVVMITGLDKVAPAVRALRAGASDYLVKPVAREALAHALQRCLAMRRVLRENGQLRSGLALLEWAQRISNALDRQSVADCLLAGLHETVGYKAAAVLVPDEAQWTPIMVDALGGTTLEQVVRSLAAGPLSQPLTRPVVVDALDGTATMTSISGLSATVLPVVAHERLLAAAVLFVEGLPAPGTLAAFDLLTGAAATAMGALEHRAQVERLVWIDDLTGLYNARFLQHVLERETGEGGSGRFAVLFIDLDHFKDVNDQHGHLVGSRMIVETAQLIRHAVRDSDVCVRYGGDEFCVVLDHADQATALQVAERVRKAIEEHRLQISPGVEARVTASIGVSLHPEHGHDATSLLDLADRALYQGKISGRNVIRFAA